MNQQLSIHFYDGPMLSVKETAYRLHVSSDTIYAWVKAGILPAFQPGGARHAIQIAEADVQDLLRNCSPARRQMKTTLTSEPVSRTKSHGQSHQVLDSRWVSIGNNNALSLQWNMERASPIQDLGSSEISAVAGNAPGTAIPWLDQERTSHYESAIPGSQQDDNDDAPGPQRDESGDPAPDALLLCAIAGAFGSSPAGCVFPHRGGAAHPHRQGLSRSRLQLLADLSRRQRQLCCQ